MENYPIEEQVRNRIIELGGSFLWDDVRFQRLWIRVTPKFSPHAEVSADFYAGSIIATWHLLDTLIPILALSNEEVLENAVGIMIEKLLGDLSQGS